MNIQTKTTGYSLHLRPIQKKKDENEDFYSNASWDVDLSFVVRQRQNLISEDEERTEKGNRSVYQQSRD